LIAWPLPQPKSATSAPARRRSGGQRQDDVDERGVEACAALLGHQLVEAGIFAVGQPAARAETVDDLLFDVAE
jgi:hypothetical protein